LSARNTNRELWICLNPNLKLNVDLVSARSAIPLTRFISAGRINFLLDAAAKTFQPAEQVVQIRIDGLD
jgi:hypothetical protein